MFSFLGRGILSLPATGLRTLTHFPPDEFWLSFSPGTAAVPFPHDYAFDRVAPFFLCPQIGPFLGLSFLLSACEEEVKISGRFARELVSPLQPSDFFSSLPSSLRSLFFCWPKQGLTIRQGPYRPLELRLFRKRDLSISSALP